MKVVYYFTILCMLIGLIYCDESTSYHEDGTDDVDDVEESPTINEGNERNDLDEEGGVEEFHDAPAKCKLVIDVGFILDSSGSIRYYYQDEKNFLKILSKAFGISEGGSHAGVVTFSSDAVISIKLNQYKDQTSFEKAVDRIPLMAKLTRIDKALNLAWKDIFTTANGARRNVPRLIVLITDGEQTTSRGAENPAIVAAKIRKAGIKTLVIGIGGRYNGAELANIGGGADKWYGAKDWNILKSTKFVNKMTKAICKVAKAPATSPPLTEAPATRPPVTAAPPKCKLVIDVGFILDSSGSITYYYQDEKNFLKSLTKVFGVNEAGSHAGVVTFSADAVISIKLNQYKEQASFDKAVDRIPLMGSVTRIDKALNLAWKGMFSTANGARRNVPKLIVLITDGEQTKSRGAEDPAIVAAKIRKAGIRTLVIGIGGGYNGAELANIGGGSDKWFGAKNWAILKSSEFINKMTKTICKVAKAPATQPPATEAPTTRAPTTKAPTTRAPTTKAPTTRAPTTKAPTTRAPTTKAPTTRAPTTKAPTTRPPATEAPATRPPATEGPVTRPPLTEAPATRAPATKKQPKCKSVADIGFILDSSGSLRRYYSQEKDFLKSLATAFGVKGGGSHAGVVTFSTRAELSIKLNKYRDQTSFNAAVDRIRFMNRGTRIDRALNLAWKQMFSPRNGARRNIPRLIILITDGTQSRMRGAQNPSVIAERIRKSGIKTLVIGVGKGINKRELSKIGGGRWYSADNWSLLKSKPFVNKLTKSVCEAVDKQ